MSLTDTQINNFIDELQNFSPELERSEIGQRWPESLIEDYSEKGSLLNLLITINIAILEELRENVAEFATGSPNTLGILSRRGAGQFYVNLTPDVTDRQLYYNQNINVTNGWQLIAQRRAAEP